MSRRFNFTGRAKIFREDVKVTIELRDNAIICNVHLRLAGYGLRPDALIVVEAERGRVMRLRNDWGYAGKAFTIDGSDSEFDISAMGDPEDVRFRVLVVEPESCRLLATAENVEAYNSGDGEAPQRSLLPIKMRDLQGGVWELENMDHTPTLVLDINLGTKQELKASPILSALLPGVVRAILVYQAHAQQGAGKDDEVTIDEGEATTWLALGKKWVGDSYPNNGDHQEIDDWAQKAATGFCREKKLRDRLINFLTLEY
ncbi:hypothetical protein ACK3YL_13275 [Aeromonas caviae]